ncbi:MAG: hypothetical protein MJZ33_11510, partial [Paludibacteraceae bacterium]|nr:hypothetical protein [Paludibacteraceae bacterium]
TGRVGGRHLTGERSLRDASFFCARVAEDLVTKGQPQGIAPTGMADIRSQDLFIIDPLHFYMNKTFEKS